MYAVYVVGAVVLCTISAVGIGGIDRKEADFRGVMYLKGVHGLGLHAHSD